MVFVGRELEHSWVPLALGPSQVYNQGVSLDCSISRLEWERICFQAHAHARWQDFAPCWPLARCHPEFLAPWTSPKGTTWQLAVSEQINKNQRERV